jgi:FAD binding domain
MSWTPDSAVETGEALRDYGGRRRSRGVYRRTVPASVDDLQAAVRYANAAAIPIRVRANGHSMNGSSIPRAGELLIVMDECRHFRFEREGTVTAGAGAAIFDLHRKLLTYGYELLVYNDGGSAAASVGGFTAAGGFGATSREHGGFWETVEEIDLVTGDGRRRSLTPRDPEFRWLFGSMGQLGIAWELKLKIRARPGAAPAYPMGVEGRVAHTPHLWEPILWYTLFVPAAGWQEARHDLIQVGVRHRQAWKGRWPYTYAIAFKRFQPPLIHPLQEPLVAVGIWGTPLDGGFDWDEIAAIERGVRALTDADPRRRRYVQSELIDEGFDFAAYFGAEVHDRFAALKREMDPRGLLVRGLLRSPA